MRKGGAVVVLGAVLLGICVPTAARAGLVNDLPSCYAAAHIEAGTPPYDDLLYVLIDETVKLDPQLEASAIENTTRLLSPSVKIVIAEFSAFSQGRYLSVLHTGIIEKPLAPERVGSTPIEAADDLGQCLSQQSVYARNMFLDTERRAFEQASSSLDRSDILAALKTVSEAVADDPAAHKTVFVISDGLENSGITSFYLHNGVRRIDPHTELARAKDAGMIGNFGGANIYFLGAALLPPSTHGDRAQIDGYRDPRTLRALQEFWSGYFELSDGRLVEFGEPALVKAVAF